MKADELMIGDILKCDENPCSGHRIDYISEMDGEIGANGEIYSLDHLFPIPITPKFLEKNGFEMDGIVYILHLDSGRDDTNYISVAFNEAKEVRAVSIDLIYYGVINVTTIHCVHELQQELRLMGKSDLADNFKV